MTDIQNWLAHNAPPSAIAEIVESIRETLTDDVELDNEKADNIAMLVAIHVQLTGREC